MILRIHTNTKTWTNDEHDIVLAKNGNITETVIDGYVEKKNDKKQRKMYNIIATGVHNIGRVLFLDDYILLNFPTYRISWFVYFISLKKN
jgi:hypothetical protein